VRDRIALMSEHPGYYSPSHKELCERLRHGFKAHTRLTSFRLDDFSYSVCVVEYGIGWRGWLREWLGTGVEIASAFEPEHTGTEVEDAWCALLDRTPHRAFMMPVDQ
jgi:hypothetical protein